MKDFDLILDGPPSLERPVMVEGLPGIGSVGRIAAKYMISALDARKFGDLYSTSFPHQVKTLPDGTVRLMRNELYHSSVQRDILYITGEMQPLPTDFRSHYAMAEHILDLCHRFKTELIITVGGYASTEEGGELPRVFGVASTQEMVSLCSEHGVEILDDGNGVPIVGASGLIPAMATMRGMKAICLLGQTTGDMRPDAEAASAVLEKLALVLGIQLELENVPRVADSIEKEMDDIIRKIERLERRGRSKPPEGGEGYIH